MSPNISNSHDSYQRLVVVEYHTSTLGCGEEVEVLVFCELWWIWRGVFSNKDVMLSEHIFQCVKTLKTFISPDILFELDLC